MRMRSSTIFLRTLSLFLLAGALLLAIFQLVSYSRIRNTFPPGMVIAGVPVGGLEQNQAADRIIQIYSLPVVLYYGDSIIHLKPSQVGFELEIETMLAAGDLQRVNQPFWNAFWSYLWNQLPEPTEVPIRASVSEERLRSYLVNEIAARYDKLPGQVISPSGSVTFQAGESGTSLDIDRAMILVESALRSAYQREVKLTYSRISPPRPSMYNLKVLLERQIELSDFSGIAEIYLLDLQTREEMHFAFQNDQEIEPNIAFTAASTIKIPIMVSTFIRAKEPAPAGTTQLLELMIERSENDPADTLMEELGGNLGPLLVTEHLQAIGLENTFLAGYFYIGAPLLQRFQTPANSRTDFNTFPDAYNQTTPLEIGMLLDDIYQCAEKGGGTLIAAFPGEITQQECKLMISHLERNKIGILIQAGVPDGTRVAHKHGWIIESDGLMHAMSDVGIIYSPGGNYVLTIFLYDPVQIFFDPQSELIANLSAAVYNYFNYSTE